jgi:hypothetical protein
LDVRSENELQCERLISRLVRPRSLRFAVGSPVCARAAGHGYRDRHRARAVDESLHGNLAFPQRERYVGPAEGAAYVQASPGTDVIVRIEPGDLRTWDFADEYTAG